MQTTAETTGLTAAACSAVLRIALLAAAAGGPADAREAERLAAVGRRNAGQPAEPPARVASLQPADRIGDAAAALGDCHVRRLAYEVAVGTCAADGLRSADETRFLARLGAALGLDQPAIVSIASIADALATVPLASLSSPGVPAVDSAPPAPSELDALIRDSAVTCAALAGMPDLAAAMAVIPLQCKLVFRIGRTYGGEPTRAEARELLLSLGAGATAQFVEQVERRLAAPPMERSGEASVVAFALALAIGHGARCHFTRGAAAAARDAFAERFEQALLLAPQVDESIEQRAHSIDLRRLVQFVRAQ
jgi:uncharacterized protein (DUF697 family)